MNMDQDLTPKERADDRLLEQLLGRSGAAPREGGRCDAGETSDRMSGHGGFGVRGLPATLYLPEQPFEEVYDEQTALARGTIFRALDLPFIGGKGGKGYGG